ncbi:hypothetical protein RHSIM_Rhsim13G0144400 [Rhododendron simsii]|uniref:inositol-phosphate phosphatase n=1 Tax=Rhododendron simsii TaxID=118357 RepID=A0A834L6H2_RHOSS|nr:hypothetical protein RHSIM_Rhsim13G0144400 [Rhododendron simsii]
MAAKDSHTEFLAVAIDAAKKAGDVIRKGFYVTKHVEHKGQVDLVTETDKACEDLIFNHLKQHFPNHKFIGEETTAAYGVTELTDEETWIVDPLDGTTNFVHGFPFVCVSIGLTIEKVPVVGVVYNPIMDELFTGIHGKGAFLNGNPIKVSSQSELVKSLLCTEGKGKGLVLQFDSQHGGSQPLKLTPSTAYYRDLKVNMMLRTSKSMWNFGFMFSHSEHGDAESLRKTHVTRAETTLLERAGNDRSETYGGRRRGEPGGIPMAAGGGRELRSESSYPLYLPPSSPPSGRLLRYCPLQPLPSTPSPSPCPPLHPHHPSVAHPSIISAVRSPSLPTPTSATIPLYPQAIPANSTPVLFLRPHPRPPSSSTVYSNHGWNELVILWVSGSIRSIFEALPEGFELGSVAGTKRDKPTVDATTNRINSLLFKVRSLRMCGSCALDLCGIACGRIDLFYELGFGGPWDVAGGAVIVKEAGGVIFDPSGKEFDITSQRVAASNPLLKDAFRYCEPIEHQAGTKRDKPTVDATTNRINSLLFKVRSLRMCGSCALDLCGIACGRIDLFYELGFGGPWDVAGGAVIVKEAGGVIFDPSGKEFDITSQRVAASNPLLKDAFVEALRELE